MVDARRAISTVSPMDFIADKLGRTAEPSALGAYRDRGFQVILLFSYCDRLCQHRGGYRSLISYNRATGRGFGRICFRSANRGCHLRRGTKVGWLGDVTGDIFAGMRACTAPLYRPC